MFIISRELENNIAKHNRYDGALFTCTSDIIFTRSLVVGSSFFATEVMIVRMIFLMGVRMIKSAKNAAMSTACSKIEFSNLKNRTSAQRRWTV